MEEKFVITEIKRIVMVGKNEYSEPMLSFYFLLITSQKSRIKLYLR